VFTLSSGIVEQGTKEALKTVPIATFGKLVTADRWEIEEFNRISNQVQKYLETGQNRPLSIGVFGEPGSGKSFVIKQIVKGITQKFTKKGPEITEEESPKRKFPVLNYNLSQFLAYSSFLVPFQTIRDKSVSGRIPILSFDEFDTYLNGEFGWVKFFLAPMQDGEFLDNVKIRPIGKAISIFIGGTSTTFKHFKENETQFITAGTTHNTVQIRPEDQDGLNNDDLNEFLKMEEAKAQKAARAVKQHSRWKGIHDVIWRDKNVKNVHYILSPKPWDEWADGQGHDPSHVWWISLNAERLAEEQQRDLTDGF
jgi:hypothetical protein